MSSEVIPEHGVAANGPARCRVLLVDDDAIQLKLSRIHLIEAGFDVESASGADEALSKAMLRKPDAVLSDVLMRDLDGFMLCRSLRAQSALADVPVILLSAHYTGEADQALALRVGATALIARTPDFKAELAALEHSLSARTTLTVGAPDATLYEQHLRTNASQLSKLLGQAKKAEERYHLLFQNARDTIAVLSMQGVILEANERWRDALGIDPEQMIGHCLHEYADVAHESGEIEAYNSTFAKAAGQDERAVALRRADGATIYMQFSKAVIELEGTPIVFAIGHDITKEVEAARALAAAEEKYRTLVERIPDVIWTCAPDGSMRFMTRNVTQMLGYTPQELEAESMQARLERVHPDDRQRVTEAFQALVAEGKPFDMEYRRRHKAGHWIWLRNRAAASYKGGELDHVEGIISDLTERKRLEEIARQSQKMEAIGQLTGGIAHDFNNIVAAILANAHFLIEELAEHDPRRADAEEIKASAERAANLTRQLLAFSRRQVLAPTVVDLNAVISGLEKMLRRLIGEDIEFSVVPDRELAAVRVDVGQLEQVIMNLVLNARDAMPTGGKLSIETANARFDKRYPGLRGGVAPGSYVMLAVTDNGCGMDPETREHLFEPFFTTKAPGKGTGLGLSTCYGIVKQSGGYIFVHTEPGSGTTFKIYLPCAESTPDKTRDAGRTAVLHGHETVLLIEDDGRVRTAVCRMLQSCGYEVLVASSGGEAIQLAQTYSGTIHLVLSDVIMPGASGPEVVAKVQQLARGARALYMSGYTDHAVLRDGLLRSSVNFVQKPFAPAALAKKVREVLDG